MDSKFARRDVDKERQVLDRVAKCVGLDLVWGHVPQVPHLYVSHLVRGVTVMVLVPWQPETDKADAFDLAIRLEMELKFVGDSAAARCRNKSIQHRCPGDPTKAALKAIWDMAVLVSEI